MSCPCALTRAEVLSAHLIGDGGVCTAFKKGSRTERCGELLADHPAEGKKSIICFHSSFFTLAFVAVNI